MREPRCQRAIRVFSLAILTACLLFSATWVTAADSQIINKVLISDGTYREIANTGTLNAVNRIFGNEQIPAPAKTTAITSVLLGANDAGMLVPTTLVNGDRFFASDLETGYVVTITYQANDFVLPGGTGFTVMSIPPG